MFRFSLSTVSPLFISLLLPSGAFAQEPPTEEAPEPEGATEAVAPPEPEAGEAEATAPTPTGEAPSEATAPPIVEETAPAPAPELTPSATVAPQAETVALEGEEAAPEKPAPTLLPLKIGTDTWSRFEYRHGYGRLGVSRGRFQDGDETVFRTRLTIQTNPLQLTKTIQGLVYMAPQASGSWGMGAGGGTIGEVNLGLYEGYVLLKGETLETKFGRFAMNYGDAVVIGNLDWHQAGRSFDGVHFRLKPGKLNIDAFLTQQTEGYPALNQPFLVGDNYFWGVYGKFGPAISEGLDLDVYVLGKSAAATDVTTPDPDPTLPPVVTHKEGATHVTLGARVKQALGMFDYRVEAGVQLGKAVGPATENVGKSAYQIDGDFGLTFGPKIRVALGGAIASGDDPDTTDKNEAWDELYPTTHKWLGLMDVIGFRTNIASGNLKIKVPLGSSTVAQVHAHVFTVLEPGALGYVGDEDFAGYEVDAMVDQKIGEWAYAHALYGVFLPNEEHYASGDPAQYVEVQAGLKF